MPLWFHRLTRLFRTNTADFTMPDFSRRRFDAVGAHFRNLRKLQRRYNPLKAARAAALNTAPGSETTRGHYEHTAAEGFQREIDALKKLTEKHMQILEMDIRRLPPMPSPNKIDIISEAQSLEAATFQTWHDRLVKARLGALLNKRQLNYFRRTNQVIRDVETYYPVIAALGALAACIFEAFLNFNYLAPTGVGAPTEVLVFVIGMALINVAIGIICGYLGVRNLNHIVWYRKLFGTLIVISAVSLALLLHSVLANYRHAIDLIESDQSLRNNASALLARLAEIQASIARGTIASPLEFVNDPKADGVFLYGLLFFIFAVWEGSKYFNDPYPGLAECDRSYNRARERSEAIFLSFRAEINKVVQDVRASLDANVTSADHRLKSVKSCLDSASRLIQQYEREATRAEGTLVRMLDDYRSEYRLIRESNGPQLWEDDDARLDRELPFQLDHLIQIEEVETANFQAVSAEVDIIKTELVTQQSNMLTRIEAYLSAIDREAVSEVPA